MIDVHVDMSLATLGNGDQPTRQVENADLRTRQAEGLQSGLQSGEGLLSGAFGWVYGPLVESILRAQIINPLERLDLVIVPSKRHESKSNDSKTGS